MTVALTAMRTGTTVELAIKQAELALDGTCQIGFGIVCL